MYSKLTLLTFLKDLDRSIMIFHCGDTQCDLVFDGVTLPNDFRITGNDLDSHSAKLNYGRSKEIDDEGSVTYFIKHSNGLSEMVSIPLEDIFAIEDIETGMCVKFEYSMPTDVDDDVFEDFEETPSYEEGGIETFERLGLLPEMRIHLFTMGYDPSQFKLSDFDTDLSFDELCQGKGKLNIAKRIRYMYEANSLIDPVRLFLNKSKVNNLPKDIVVTSDDLPSISFVMIGKRVSNPTIKTSDIGINFSLSAPLGHDYHDRRQVFIPWNSVIGVEFIETRFHGDPLMTYVSFPENATDQDQIDLLKDPRFRTFDQICYEINLISEEISIDFDDALDYDDDDLQHIRNMIHGSMQDDDDEEDEDYDDDDYESSLASLVSILIRTAQAQGKTLEDMIEDKEREIQYLEDNDMGEMADIDRAVLKMLKDLAQDD